MRAFKYTKAYTDEQDALTIGVQSLYS